MGVEDAKKYLSQGHFKEGSMKPKIEAGVQFLANGGERCIIGSLHAAHSALSHHTLHTAHHFLHTALLGQLLHHFLHLLILFDQAIQGLKLSTRTLRNPSLAGTVKDIRVAPFSAVGSG